jgi:hypothetical protein
MTDAKDVRVLNEFNLFVCDDGKGACDHYDCTGERKMASEIVRLRAEVSTLTRERDEARDAFDTVIFLAPIYCEHLHHTKKDYHKSGEPCPVEARIKALIQITQGDA